MPILPLLKTVTENGTYIAYVRVQKSPMHERYYVTYYNGTFTFSGSDQVFRPLADTTGFVGPLPGTFIKREEDSNAKS